MQNDMFMKNRGKNFSVWLAAVFTMACFIISCDETATKKEGVTHDPSKPVIVTSFFPDSGRYRHKVILDGENFGSDPSKVRVYFNKKKAVVIGSTGSRMYVIVPRIAEDIACEVTVAVGDNPVAGKDSITYVEKFRYSKVVMVTTLCGNGTQTNTPGNLAQATIVPTSLDVDNNGNVFVSVEYGFPGSGSGDVGLVRINEEEDLMEIVINLGSLSSDANGNRYQGINCDRKTNIMYTMHRRNVNSYVVLDPAENWLPRVKLINWDNANPEYGRPQNLNQYAGFNQNDGCIYVRYIEGHIARIDPRTSRGTIIYKTTQPASGVSSIGLDFDPNNPDWCYVTGNTTHGLYRFNVKNPAGTWQRLNTPTAAGHRDGPIEQAQFNTLYGCRFDSKGNLYICDYTNRCIRKYNPESGQVTTFTGIPGKQGNKDGGPDEAEFNTPFAIGIDLEDNLYIADRTNNRVRKISIE